MKPIDFLEFLNKTQHLKSILRHSWTDDIERQESVAEHSWHMAVMAIALSPYLKNKIDLFRVLKLISIHDIGESITGDIPAFNGKHNGKYESERKAVEEIIKSLPSERKEEILRLWEEYEQKKTRESIFVKMLDVLDVLFQHLVADITTWAEKETTFNLNRNSEEYFKEEPFMLELYDLIHTKLDKKVKEFKG